MKLIDEALQSHSCVISVMGAHANEGNETIFGRKMQDIDKTGTTYWLMRSPKARPPEVQDICKTTTSYVIFIEPATKRGARPTTTEDAASQFSPDRRSWKALPPGIGPVTGKLDTCRHGTRIRQAGDDSIRDDRPLGIRRGSRFEDTTQIHSWVFNGVCSEK